jgi:hypothetical protein
MANNAADEPDDVGLHECSWTGFKLGELCIFKRKTERQRSKEDGVGGYRLAWP